MSAPSEHDCIALPDTDTSLNLKETELRLGLPGTHHSPHRRVCLFGKNLDSNDKSNGFAVTPLKNLASAIDEPNEKWILPMIASASAGAIKVPVEGWPPVRFYRKNTMGSNLAKNGDDEDGCLYVKVSMDGAPYLRKVDLKTCKNYVELSSALEKMFGCFTISEYMVTYEDKDGDWMLVGDVPWQMFTDSCRRLRIQRQSDH